MRLRTRQGGMALIEALVAVVLLGVGLLGVIGMQARSSSALADAGMRAEATLAADKLLGTMAIDLANLDAYAVAPNAAPGARLKPWHDDTRAHIPNAVIGVTVADVAGTSRTRVEVTISWTRKAGTAQNTHHIVSYLAPAT